MKDRIFGTECEYAVSLRSKKNDSSDTSHRESLLERRKNLAASLLSGVKQSPYTLAGEFLENGGRLYIDRGGHPEYATPECRSASDLVAYEKAGDKICKDLAGMIPGLYIYKNNVDFSGVTYGGHENYLIEPLAMEHIHRIIPFLITRQLYTGAGKVSGQNASQDVPFQLTQRADFINQVFSDRTSGVRGIINIRKREIVSPGKNRRLHIIFGDSNMSQFAIWLKIGTTALVLRLLEEKDLTKHFRQVPDLASPVDAFKRISNHFHYPLETEEKGRTYTALEIQKLYLEQVHQFFEWNLSTPEETEILKQWENTLNHLDNLKFCPETGGLDEDNPLIGKIDWITKLWLINRIRRQQSLHWHDLKLNYLDVNYHNLDTEIGLFNRCEKMGLTQQLVDDADIRKAAVDPPSNTRAWIRGNIIKEAKHKPVDVMIKDWETIRISLQRKKLQLKHQFNDYARKHHAWQMKLEDPFLSESTDILNSAKNFINSIRSES